MENKNKPQEWKEQYHDMIVEASEAVSQIQPGQRVFIGTGCAQPNALVGALVDRSDQLVDTEIVHLLTMGEAPYTHKTLAQKFIVNSFFIAENVRDTIQEGLGDYTPIFLSDIPTLFKTGQMPLDVALIQVTPPDDRGYCSLGVSVDIVKSAAENARLVIAQVNEDMPRTLGQSFLHVHDFDFLVPVNEPIFEARLDKLTEQTSQIGNNVASLIEDGSTIELGIGRIPHAVLLSLDDKKDLGIHSEMFTDAVMEMIEKGIITGACKSVNKDKVVASFCMGSKKLYDYIDNNPKFAFYPTEYVNDPFVISQQSKMVAVNVALEVDLTGQVCADSLGTKFYSGIGGQVDFNRGAARSKGGRAIIALEATAKKGSVSRIVSTLKPGAGVVTSRGDVHYVVTEFGVAYLHGKTVQERALALISISHPDYRVQLMKEAIEAGYVRKDLARVEDKIHVGPKELKTTFVLNDATQVFFRSVHLTDEPKVKELMYSLSEKSVYTRFMSNMRWVSKKQVQDFVYIDHRDEIEIVGCLPESDGDKIIAMGGYYLNPKTNRAEVAFVVQDEWQQKGIGSFLFKYLGMIARMNGIAGFTAEVLVQNAAMQAVFNSSGLKTTTKRENNVVCFTMEFGS
jgi:acyl-CoA hydrolase